MTRSARIPVLSLAAALILVIVGACGSSLSEFGQACSVYAATPDCEAPNACFCRVGQNCVCTTRCEADKDCPAGSNTVCLAGQNPATNTQDLFCFRADAGGRP